VAVLAAGVVLMGLVGRSGRAGGGQTDGGT
jgi:hypothetical protein